MLRPKQQLTTPTQRKKREKRVRPRSASGNVPRALCPPRRPPRLDCLRQPAAPGQHPAPGQRPAPGEPPAPGQPSPRDSPQGGARTRAHPQDRGRCCCRRGDGSAILPRVPGAHTTRGTPGQFTKPKTTPASGNPHPGAAAQASRGPRNALPRPNAPLSASEAHALCRTSARRPLTTACAEVTSESRLQNQSKAELFLGPTGDHGGHSQLVCASVSSSRFTGRETPGFQ